MGSESNLETQENAPKLLARVTFSRHEETNYTGVGRDITERGVTRAQEKGRTIAKEKGTPVIIGHSPKERAKGTAESIAEGAQDVAPGSTQARWIRVPGLRSTDFHDEEFRKYLLNKVGPSQATMTEAHYSEPLFYDNPNKIETNEEKRTRLYREIDRLASFLEKLDLDEEVPHLVFVSHYEILTLLLDDVFGIKTFGTTNVPTFGEHIDVDLYKPLPSGDIPVRIQYGGHDKQVLFDRKLRRLVAKSK